MLDMLEDVCGLLRAVRERGGGGGGSGSGDGGGGGSGGGGDDGDGGAAREKLEAQNETTMCTQTLGTASAGCSQGATAGEGARNRGKPISQNSKSNTR